MLDGAGDKRTPLVKGVREGQDRGVDMLEHLFGSRTRVKLLTLFIHHPDEGFFVRELTRRIQTQINAVRREIQNLERIGLIIESEAKPEEGATKRPGLKRKYYIANKQYPLYQEMHSLLTKAHLFLERKLDERIRKLGDVQYLAFMGSFLGSPGPVDIFLIGEVRENDMKKLVYELERELGHEINYSCMTLSDYTYRKDVADRFLASILLAPKQVMIDLMNKTVR